MSDFSVATAQYASDRSFLVGRHAIDEFIEWYCSEPRLSFSKIVDLRYRIHLESRHLAPGTINLRIGAVRRLAYEASDFGLLSPDLAADHGSAETLGSDVSHSVPAVAQCEQGPPQHAPGVAKALDVIQFFLMPKCKAHKKPSKDQS